MRRIVVTIVTVLLTLVLSGCDVSSSTGSSANANTQNQKVANQQLQNFNQAQPVPTFNWSQIRQTLIEIESAQANTTQTTSFFYNLSINSLDMVDPELVFLLIIAIQSHLLFLA